MSNYFKNRAVTRILDANINRTKEGLRVCEEIARFALNSRKLTADFKNIRHKVDCLLKYLYPCGLLKARASLKDVGRTIYTNELKRNSLQDLFLANIQRAKESVRVLEEFSKLNSKDLAIKFKRIRYGIYEVEKKVAARFTALRNLR